MIFSCIGKFYFMYRSFYSPQPSPPPLLSPHQCSSGHRDHDSGFGRAAPAECRTGNCGNVLRGCAARETLHPALPPSSALSLSLFSCAAPAAPASAPSRRRRPPSRAPGPERRGPGEGGGGKGEGAGGQLRPGWRGAAPCRPSWARPSGRRSTGRRAGPRASAAACAARRRRPGACSRPRAPRKTVRPGWWAGKC